MTRDGNSATNISVAGPSGLAGEVIALGNRLQQAFRFLHVPAGQTPMLRIAERERAALFTANRGGVVVTAWRAEGVTRYLGVPAPAYVLVASVLGLIQWRALTLNDALEPADLAHECPHECLFARQLLLEEYALRFEDPQVCLSCIAFYSFLIPRREITALRDILDFVRMSTPAFACGGIPLHGILGAKHVGT